MVTELSEEPAHAWRTRAMIREVMRTAVTETMSDIILAEPRKLGSAMTRLVGRGRAAFSDLLDLVAEDGGSIMALASV